MRLIQIPVPEEHLDQVAQALAGIDDECPRHGKKARFLVVVDECQWQLLKLIELIEHGHVEIDVAEGRPNDINHHMDVVAGVSVCQSYRTSKDDIGKIARLVESLKVHSPGTENLPRE